MLKRRDFLRATVVSTLAAALPACVSEDVTPARPTPARELVDGAKFFPQSVASGDPKPESVILWTRVADDAHADEDLSLELEVATDEAFAELVGIDEAAASLTAEATFGGCVKVRLTGLAPQTIYYYRFIYTADDGKAYVSHVGRTKTAPAADADVPVKFAYVSCQDFVGRYFNSHAALAQEDLDFFVHLGDYIYETTGDPGFQGGAPARKMIFTDEASAIQLGSGDTTYYAAKSISNYRDLYRTIRGDAALQKVHELFPMVATWDDHEYSDDCHGAVATYYDGTKDETDVERRKAANQVWFEYMPVDYLDAPEFRYDPAADYPDDIRIYRDLVFGKNVHLVMTDLRTYRADHLIPEEAFPGTVVADQATLEAALTALPDVAAPYIDVATYQGGIYADALIAAAPTLGFDAALVTGNLSVEYVNALVATINEGKQPADQLPAIDPLDPTLEKGLAWIDLGKQSLHASIGSRYLVLKDAFDIVAKLQYDATSGAAQQVLGKDQRAWFLDTMKKSTATWKIWGNEYCLTQLAIDLTQQAGAPPSFQKRFYMNADAWDGFRDERSAILTELAALDGVIAVTGDIHAFYAATPTVIGDPDKKIVEFVGSSVSSQTFKNELLSQVKTDPVLSKVPQAALLAGLIDTLFMDEASKINPHLGYADSDSNGYCVAEVSADEVVVSMRYIASKEVGKDMTADPKIGSKFKTLRFKTVAGGHDLFQEIEGAWKKWDMATQSWT